MSKTKLVALLIIAAAALLCGYGVNGEAVMPATNPASLSAAGPQAGDVVFQTGFEAADVLRTWQAERNPSVRLVDGIHGVQALEIAALPGVGGLARVALSLPVAGLRGARLSCRAMIKADGVTPPPKPWNGIKFMLHLTGPGGELWLQQNNVAGTFDWKVVQFKASVPENITAAELILGLEAVNGKAWFDDMKISVLHGPRPRPSTVLAGPVYTGHSQPRLRGAMISTNVKEADLDTLGGEWGANLVRWQLTWNGFPHSPADNGDLAAYDTWLEGALQHVDELLPVCEKLGIKVVIDIHTAPGGRNAANECQLFHEKRFQDNFLKWWGKIASRYNGNKTVWGYDLFNEPVEGEGDLGAGCMDWQELATAAARIVRQHDANHAIIVEPEPWGGPEALDNLQPLPVPGVVYSVHMYVPHLFTHQGVYDIPLGPHYPGLIDGKPWDKDQLRRVLQPVIKWQHDYGVQIYIGEFSAIRWAPDDSAYRYLKDCIDIFEENGWDWSYHAFREWSGWSVEHTADKNDTAPSKTETVREKLLRDWFQQNAR